MYDLINPKMLRQSWEESWNRGDFKGLNRILAPDYVPHHPLNPVMGAEGLQQFIGIFQEAFPDLVFSVDDIISAQDKVVVRWSMRGTHQVDLLGIPPTGKAATLTGISIYRFEDGHTVESWDEVDIWNLLYQLGVLQTQ